MPPSLIWRRDFNRDIWIGQDPQTGLEIEVRAEDIYEHLTTQPMADVTYQSIGGRQISIDPFGRTELDGFVTRYPGVLSEETRPQEKKYFCRPCVKVITLPGNYFPRCPHCKGHLRDGSYEEAQRRTAPRKKAA